MRKERATLREIGKALGVSSSSARLYLHKAARYGVTPDMSFAEVAALAAMKTRACRYLLEASERKMEIERAARERHAEDQLELQFVEGAA
jgi:hypothetical protein